MARRVSADLNGLASELDTICSKALEGVARDAKAEMVRVAQRAGGGDGKVSGANAKLNARYDHQKGAKGLTVRVRAVGRWQLVEYPRRGGYRIPKRNGKGRNRQRRGKPRLHIGGGWATGPIRGGPAGGKLWWNRAAPDVMNAAGDDFADAVIKVITGKWR